MSKENNDLFNFPVNPRGQQERVSFEGGGEVDKEMKPIYKEGGKFYKLELQP